MAEIKKGWAIVDLHNGSVTTCAADVHSRDSIVKGMLDRGVPMTKIHLFEFLSHRRLDTRVGLTAPLTEWVR